MTLGMKLSAAALSLSFIGGAFGQETDQNSPRPLEWRKGEVAAHCSMAFANANSKRKDPKQAEIIQNLTAYALQRMSPAEVLVATNSATRAIAQNYQDLTNATLANDSIGMQKAMNESIQWVANCGTFYLKHVYVQ